MPVDVTSLPETQYRKDLTKLNKAGLFCLFSPSIHKNGNNFARYGKDLNKLTQLIPKQYNWDERNWYLTVNSLKNWHRASNNVLGLNAIFIDVDCVKNGIDKGKFLYDLPKLLALAKLPKPDVEKDSGHGIYLLWYFDKQVIVHNQCINRLWNKLERTTVKNLNKACINEYGKPLGDIKATDASRILRVSNTWNVKTTPVKCRLIKYQHQDRPNMFKWVDDYLPKIRYKRPQTSKIRRFRRLKKHYHITIKKTKYTLNGCRVADLRKWLEMHHNNITGKREEFLFLYSCFAIHCETPISLGKDLNYLNNKFTKPLPETEIVNLKIEIGHVNIKKYKFKNSTLIKLLGITDKEQQHLSTIINRKERYRRDSFKKRKNTRQKKSKLIMKIIKLKNKKYNYRQISKKLHVGQTTISKAIKPY